MTPRTSRLEWIVEGRAPTVTDRFLRHRLTQALSVAFAALMAGGFLLFVASAIASEGVCCADDGIYAGMAKNLAFGLGFSTTLQAENSAYQVIPFDPKAGGPAVVLPAAALVKLFGNRAWVPGLAAAICWFAAFAACFRLLGPGFEKAPAGIALGAFAGFLFALFPYHFEQWYALLGEVPASALILLAVVAWGLKPEEPARLRAAGALLGLAVLSKALALLWLGVVVLAAAAHAAPDPSRSGTWVTRMARVGLGIAVPLGLFEVWKFAAMGWVEYWRVQGTALSFVAFRGVARSGPDGLTARMLSNAAAFQDRFALPLGVVLAAAVCGAGVAWWRGSAEVRRIAAVLVAGLGVHVAWWLAVSDGRPRYMVIALIPAAFLICLPLATARSGPELFGIALAVTLLSTPAWGRLSYPLSRVRIGTFEASERNRHGQEVTRFLEREAAGRTVFTEWWAMVSALDYQSGTRIRFQPLGAVPARDPREDFFVVVDERFSGWSGLSVAALVEPCGSPVLQQPPYSVFHCR